MAWNEMRAYRMRHEDMMRDFEGDTEKAYKCGYHDGYAEAMEEAESMSPISQER